MIRKLVPAVLLTTLALTSLPADAQEPKVEAPKIEEPKVEVPKVEEPKMETPKVEEPKVEDPKMEAPKQEGLFRREVDQKYTGGKVLKMSFEETSRDEKTSIAKAVIVAGAMLPSKVFVLRSAYLLAMERKSSHFIKLDETKQDDGSIIYRVGFTNDPNVDPVEYFKLDKPLPKEEGYQMQSVKDLEILFKGM